MSRLISTGDFYYIYEAVWLLNMDDYNIFCLIASKITMQQLSLKVSMLPIIQQIAGFSYVGHYKTHSKMLILQYCNHNWEES